MYPGGPPSIVAANRAFSDSHGGCAGDEDLRSGVGMKDVVVVKEAGGERCSGRDELVCAAMSGW
jgi:hypothetical protein